MRESRDKTCVAFLVRNIGTFKTTLKLAGTCGRSGRRQNVTQHGGAEERLAINHDGPLCRLLHHSWSCLICPFVAIYDHGRPYRTVLHTSGRLFLECAPDLQEECGVCR